MRHVTLLLALTLSCLICTLPARAENAGSPPPAPVAAARVETGVIQPTTLYAGTAYFTEMSEVAAETEGKVESYSFEVGDRVAAGQVLVRLNTDLLGQQLKEALALLEEAESALEEADRNFARFAELYKDGSVSEQEYDDRRFILLSRRARAASLRATVDRLRLEIAKASIPAPFAGVVTMRRIDRGEWLEQGDPVAEIAAATSMDVIVDLPQETLSALSLDERVTVSSGASTWDGILYAVVPAGDVATRTFPARIRVASPNGLLQGMEVMVELPSGEPREALIVPRDALLRRGREWFVYLIDAGVVRSVTVELIGFSGLSAGVLSPDLPPGVDVVVKGNERLGDGRPVRIQ